jgi:hypothetical protein
VFFEPDPAAEEVEPPTPPPLPPWTSPPADEIGVIVPIHQVVARGDNVMVALPWARVFSTGCLLNVEVVSRRGDLSPNEWWELRHSGHSSIFGGDPGILPDKMLRFGVRFPDGTKATTVRGMRRFNAPEVEPDGPRLAWTPFGGGRAGGSMDLAHMVHGLWLWPLPPAAVIEFAVEWPFGGIELTIVELDGGRITEAARGSELYWP